MIVRLVMLFGLMLNLVALMEHQGSPDAMFALNFLSACVCGLFCVFYEGR